MSYMQEELEDVWIYGLGLMLIGFGLWLGRKKEKQIIALTAIVSGLFLIITERHEEFFVF